MIGTLNPAADARTGIYADPEPGTPDCDTCYLAGHQCETCSGAAEYDQSPAALFTR
jgi:hypothetical protein